MWHSAFSGAPGGQFQPDRRSLRPRHSLQLLLSQRPLLFSPLRGAFPLLRNGLLPRRPPSHGPPGGPAAPPLPACARPPAHPGEPGPSPALRPQPLFSGALSRPLPGLFSRPLPFCGPGPRRLFWPSPRPFSFSPPRPLPSPPLLRARGPLSRRVFSRAPRPAVSSLPCALPFRPLCAPFPLPRALWPLSLPWRPVSALSW